MNQQPLNTIQSLTNNEKSLNRNKINKNINRLNNSQITNKLKNAKYNKSVTTNNNIFAKDKFLLMTKKNYLTMLQIKEKVDTIFEKNTIFYYILKFLKEQNGLVEALYCTPKNLKKINICLIYVEGEINIYSNRDGFIGNLDSIILINDPNYDRIENLLITKKNPKKNAIDMYKVTIKKLLNEIQGITNTTPLVNNIKKFQNLSNSNIKISSIRGNIKKKIDDFIIGMKFSNSTSNDIANLIKIKNTYDMIFGQLQYPNFM